ncbi:MAG TPA: A/G-specific adenine glycosylase [bacterium]|nr:A/G-specific adenine glycosylase [bacterium]HPN45248.1 A/G-specific adenine glycosylase [bacterium]
MLTDKYCKIFREDLAAWFDRECRNLPWRETGDPYNIWISEIMLQQTQVSKVIPYYTRFITAFPDIKTLAEVDLDRVLKVWEGLGYYARARNIHKTAGIILHEFQSVYPEEYAQIASLPGIGPYTAAAIASIAFNQQYAVVDGNVRRVLCRILRFIDDPDTSQGKMKLQDFADTLLDKAHPGNYNQALMELGALVCTPKNPRCEDCPLSVYCLARAAGEQQVFPMHKPVKKRPHYNIAAGLICNGEKLLIARRPEKGMLGGLWEFPGGKQEPGESLDNTVVREVREELDVQVQVEKPVTTINHQYTHFTITLHIYICTFIGGEPKPLGCTDWRWVSVPELKDYAFPRANVKIIEKLLAGDIQLLSNTKLRI